MTTIGRTKKKPVEISNECGRRCLTVQTAELGISLPEMGEI